MLAREVGDSGGRRGGAAAADDANGRQRSRAAGNSLYVRRSTIANGSVLSATAGAAALSLSLFVSRKETGGSARLHLHFVVDPCRRASSRSDESLVLSQLPLLSFPQFRSLVTGSLSSLSFQSAPCHFFLPCLLTSDTSTTTANDDEDRGIGDRCSRT